MNAYEQTLALNEEVAELKRDRFGATTEQLLEIEEEIVVIRRLRDRVKKSAAYRQALNAVHPRRELTPREAYEMGNLKEAIIDLRAAVEECEAAGDMKRAVWFTHMLEEVKIRKQELIAW